MLSLVFIVLGLCLNEPLLGCKSSLLECANLIVKLIHLGIGFVHEVLILVNLLLEGQKNASGDAGAIDATDVCSGNGEALWGMRVTLLVLGRVIEWLRHAVLLWVWWTLGRARGTSVARKRG